MKSIARTWWHKAVGSIVAGMRAGNATDVAASAERESETLRQLSDVFGEIHQMSADFRSLASQIQELQLKADANSQAVRELHAATTAELEAVRATVAVLATNQEVQSTNQNEATELIGRLVEKARLRIDAIEGQMDESPG